jgi:ADP-heptose:LPS heptosyltransferase
MTETACRVVFSGEPEEKPLIEEIQGLMSRKTHSAIGLVTIRQLGVLMQRARLVITNDSASLHLASAMDVPTIALFGPTDERKYGPTASRHHTLRRHLFCTPCEQALCRFSHECMRFIGADEVYAAAVHLLTSARCEVRGEGN